MAPLTPAQTQVGSGGTSVVGAAGAGKSYSLTFAGAGSYTVNHGLGSQYPEYGVYPISGSTSVTITPVDANNVTVTVPAASQFALTLSPGSPTATTVTPAATPTFSPAAGSYSSAQTVTIADTTGGSTIHYTTDGSTPTISSATYTAPLTVNASETINAFAAASGHTQSAIGSAVYNLAGAIPGLVDNWPLSEPSGLTFADSVGTNTITALSGTMTQGTVTGLSGSVPIFSGTTGKYAQAANGLGTSFINANTQPFSVSLWATFTTAGTFDMVADATTGDNTGFYILRNTSNQIQLNYCGSACTSSGGFVSISSATISTGTLYHIVWTYDGSGSSAGVKLYLNGALATTTNSGTLAGTITAAALRLGSDASGSSPHSGGISRVRTYNIALTSSQVSQIYSGAI